MFISNIPKEITSIFLLLIWKQVKLFLIVTARFAEYDCEKELAAFVKLDPPPYWLPWVCCWSHPTVPPRLWCQWGLNTPDRIAISQIGFRHLSSSYTWLLYRSCLSPTPFESRTNTLQLLERLLKPGDSPSPQFTLLRIHILLQAKPRLEVNRLFAQSKSWF